MPYSIGGGRWPAIGAPVAAAGLAQINALGNLSGFFCNYLIGTIKSATGTFPLALRPIAVLGAAGMVALLLIARGQPRTAANLSGQGPSQAQLVDGGGRRPAGQVFAEAQERQRLR